MDEWGFVEVIIHLPCEHKPAFMAEVHSGTQHTRYVLIMTHPEFFLDR